MNAGRLQERLRDDPLLEDVLLAAALALFALITTLALVLPAAGPDVPRTGIVIAWAILFMAPLALRRRWPVAVMAVMTAHFLVYWPVGRQNEIAAWVALGIAVYTAAAHGRRPMATRAFVACAGVLLGVVLLVEAGRGRLGVATAVAGLLFMLVPFGLGWPVGSMMRQLRQYRSELETRNAELAAERDARAEGAVLAERVRIARELHDVVAHHVSVMAVQAAAARRLFRTRPDDALQAIAAVEEAGREAIVDLQQLVGVLRQEEQPERAPQPTMQQLPRLLAGVEQAGLPVSLTVEGRQQALPAGVELSAYRIVQEALTNTIKHAAASRAEVVVRYRGSQVEVEVLDDGEADPGRRGRDGGKGLLGMRERVSVHGGTLDAGPRPEGGYRVRAVLRGNGP